MPPNAKDSTSGHVSRLTLENFKSWRGVHQVGPFHDGFTAVIGSNGAGKSNLMDAISFVTGVKAKRLRGDQLRDLIFDGDQLAERENRYMKVTMVYSCGKNELPGKHEGDELVFSRSVTYSTPGSTFEFGGRRIAYEEYEEMFSKLNILVSARNFLIFQGDVEATAQKTPAELSLFFEQVSGSDAFKQEYEKLFEEKKRLEEIALEKIQQAKDAKAERKEAKEQKNEKDHFDTLAVERERLRVELALFQLREASRTVEKNHAELTKTQGMIEEDEEVARTMDQERAQAAKDSAAKERELSKADEAAQTASKKINVKREAHSKKVEALKREKAKRTTAEGELDKAKEALAKHEKELADVREAISDLESKQKSLEMELKADEEEADKDTKKLSNEEREKLETLRAEADKQNSELKSEETQLVRELETRKNMLELARRNQKQTETRETDAKAELEKMEEKREKTEKQLVTQQAKLEELKKQAKSRVAQEAEITSELETKRQELEKVKVALSMSKARTAENKRTKKLEETVKSLTRNYPGVRGRMVDLIRPTHTRYALAVDTALGRHLDSIVVDKESTAFECMKYLREQRLGTATFLPLDTIEPKPISEEKRRHAQGQYRLCIDVITYDAVLERAVKFAAGDSMICENLESARELCFKRGVRVKAVTEDGHLISPRGEMTGGAMGEQGRSDRFAEAEATKAKEDRSRLETAIAELESRLSSFGQIGRGDEIVKAETSLKFLQADLQDILKTKLPDHENRVKKAVATNAEELKRVAALDGEVASLHDKLEKLRSKIAKKEEQVFKDVSGGSIPVVDRRAEEARQTKTASLKDVQEHLSKLRGQLKFLQAQKREKDVVDAEKLLKKRTEEIAKLEEEVTQAKAELDELEANAQEATVVKERATQACDLAQAKLKECQKRLEKAKEDRMKHAKEVSQLEGDIAKLKALIAEIVRQAALDGLTLPRKTDMEGEKKEELSDSDGDENAHTPTTAGSEFDFSVLRRSSKSMNSEDDFRKRISAITAELETLVPNRTADTRYNEASEKLKITDAHLKEARDAANSANAAFEHIRKQRMDTFMGMFNHVSKQIDGIYKALTKRKNAPAGGAGFLAVVDPENPFTNGVKFECMPPNKRYRPMDQLSGGEKTVAALALLFAIHSYRPSPFFVMDEVDAALDNDNVERVSDYIRMRSSQRPSDFEEEADAQDEIDSQEQEGSANKRRFQCLVISLKDSFFAKAEKLVGVYRDETKDSSNCLTLDLSQYAD